MVWYSGIVFYPLAVSTATAVRQVGSRGSRRRPPGPGPRGPGPGGPGPGPGPAATDPWPRESAGRGGSTDAWRRGFRRNGEFHPQKWWFPKHGVPLVIILILMGFSLTKTIQLLGINMWISSAKMVIESWTIYDNDIFFFGCVSPEVWDIKGYGGFQLVMGIPQVRWMPHLWGKDRFWN